MFTTFSKIRDINNYFIRISEALFPICCKTRELLICCKILFAFYFGDAMVPHNRRPVVNEKKLNYYKVQRYIGTAL